MQEKLPIQSGNKKDALVWVQSFTAQSIEVHPVASKPCTEQWTPGSASCVCFSEASLCSPAHALRQHEASPSPGIWIHSKMLQLKWKCCSGSSGRANCFLNIVIFISGREDQLTASRGKSPGEQSYMSWRSCPSLSQRAQLLVLLDHSPAPLPAIASLQPLASPWRYHKASGLNHSSTETFAKPAGENKAIDSDKTYLVMKVPLLSKDEQQSSLKR